MEHFTKERRIRQRRAKALTGIIILAFGVLFLLLRLGYQIPFWVFSWKIILIAIGAVLLYKHNFKQFGGYALIIVGSLFLLNDFKPGLIDASLIFPVIIISFGAVMVAKSLNLFKKNSKNHNTTFIDNDVDITSDDYVESTTFFGGTTKNIVSKNFSGGEFVTVFGGTEINLSQSDIQNPTIIDITTVFGGIEMSVPSNWQIKSEITTIFGSIEDKRSILNDTLVDESKTLILKGTCIFGGIEIQSYR